MFLKRKELRAYKIVVKKKKCPTFYSKWNTGSQSDKIKSMDLNNYSLVQQRDLRAKMAH